MKNFSQSENESNKDDLGLKQGPLCREPWESYYILRRGILPCCYGNPIIAPMSEWEKTWNSPQLQEIRLYLSQGKLSPYCLESLGCPIVQRVLAEKSKELKPELRRPAWMKFLNKISFRLPGKIYKLFKRLITSIPVK